MKAFYVCAIFLVVAGSLVEANSKEEMEKMKQTCDKEAPVDHADTEKFFKSGMDTTLATDPIKCHLKCIMQFNGDFKNGAFDDQHYLGHTKDMPMFKDTQADLIKAVEECKTQKGANDCDTAYKVAKCLKDHKALGMMGHHAH